MTIAKKACMHQYDNSYDNSILKMYLVTSIYKKFYLLVILILSTLGSVLQEHGILKFC